MLLARFRTPLFVCLLVTLPMANYALDVTSDLKPASSANLGLYAKPQNVQVASLHPLLAWRRVVNPDKPLEGPVLYQIQITLGTPNTFPKYDATGRHFSSSLISENGSTITVNGSVQVTGAGNKFIGDGSGLTGISSASGGTVTNITGSGGIIASPNPITNTGNLSLDQTFVRGLGDARYLQLTGGTMSGFITFANGQTFPGAGGGNFLPLTGGNLTGPETITVGSAGISGLFISETTNTNATGINVHNTATGTVTGVSNAIYGETDADNGVGVFGNAPMKTAGSSTGVFGSSSQSNGTGVGGAAAATSGTTAGVRGTTASGNGIGVVGNNTATTGPAYGVTGTSLSTSGAGVYGQASANGDSAFTTGVLGTVSSAAGTAVNGLATDTTGGTKGQSGTIGVNGISKSPNGIGINGVASDTTPVVVGGPNATPNQGTIGVQAESDSPNGIALNAFDSYQCLMPACNPTLATAPAPVGIVSQVLHANGIAVLAMAGSNQVGCVLPACDPTATGNIGVLSRSFHPNGAGVYGIANDTSTTNTAGGIFSIGVIGQARSPSGYALLARYIPASVGVGAAALFNNDTGFTPPNTPGTLCKNVAACTILELQANGTREFHFDGAGNAHAAGTFMGGGADFAESVAAAGKRADYQPGDVMIIDDAGDRSLAKSQESYSTLVAGIVSTKPGVLASLHNSTTLAGQKAIEGEVPLAVVGIVPCKVSAENGAIHAGDLLVTSSTAGYAMKGTDRARMLGAVVGKAMQALESGKGVIEVLVTLQ